MAAQTRAVSPALNCNKVSPFPFLSKPPPPPQKKRPTQPLPSLPVPIELAVTPASPPLRRRSNTFSSIATWASHVQPGSPPPRSPRRRPSITSTRRPSITRLNRRPSITHSRAPSGSFLNILDTPTTAGHRTTPSVKDFDLTNLGYTSVFVHLPKTPSTPSHLHRRAVASKPPTPRGDIFANIPIPPIPSSPPPTKTRALKHFRSLSALKQIRTRTRSKSTTIPPSPTKPKSAAPRKTDAQICAVTIAKRKKAKYAYLRPAPLANELAMMQFADGGSMDSHVKRVMEAQAKAAAGSGAQSIGVGDVFRDGKGGLWWDQDEEWEYAHLLGGEQVVGGGEEEAEWIQFDVPGDDDDKENDGALAIAGLAGEGRRGSVSTQDSDLDSRYIMEPADEQPDDGLAAFGGALAPLTLRKPGMSVLSLPSRPRRTAKHLRKPELMHDIAAFGPSSPRGKFSAASPTVGSFTKPMPKGKARRRPAPLKLAPLGPGLKRASNSPVDHEKVRRDFIDASFAPSPASPVRAVPPSPLVARGRVRKLSLTALMSSESLVPRKAVVTKPSRLNMNVKGLLKSVGGGKRDV